MTDTCGRCGRKITSSRSRKLGYGQECWTKIRAAVALVRNDYTARQIEQARELIADRGIVHLRRNVFLTVSTDGTEIHRTAPQACNCIAGLRSIHCYHTAAVKMLMAAQGGDPHVGTGP